MSRNGSILSLPMAHSWSLSLKPFINLFKPDPVSASLQFLSGSCASLTKHSQLGLLLYRILHVQTDQFLGSDAASEAGRKWPD